jgi:hypothetical protein
MLRQALIDYRILRIAERLNEITSFSFFADDYYRIKLSAASKVIDTLDGKITVFSPAEMKALTINPQAYSNRLGNIMQNHANDWPEIFAAAYRTYLEEKQHEAVNNAPYGYSFPGC